MVFQQLKYAVSTDVEGMFKQAGQLDCDQSISYLFLTTPNIPKTASQDFGLNWDHITDTLVVSQGVNHKIKDCYIAIGF